MSQNSEDKQIRNVPLPNQSPSSDLTDEDLENVAGGCTVNSCVGTNGCGVSGCVGTS